MVPCSPASNYRKDLCILGELYSSVVKNLLYSSQISDPSLSMDSEIFISEYLVPDILSGTEDATEKNTDKIPGS